MIDKNYNGPIRHIQTWSYTCLKQGKTRCGRD